MIAEIILTTGAGVLGSILTYYSTKRSTLASAEETFRTRYMKRLQEAEDEVAEWQGRFLRLCNHLVSIGIPIPEELLQHTYRKDE